MGRTEGDLSDEDPWRRPHRVGDHGRVSSPAPGDWRWWRRVRGSCAASSPAPSCQLPASDAGLRVEERPSVHLPAEPTQQRTPVNLGPNDQNTSSSWDGSSSTNMDLNTRIQAALHDIAVEEVELWRHCRQHGQFPPDQEDFSGMGLGFQVYRTPCGTVYHSTRLCTQLQGPRTGHAREFTWCELWKEVGLRPRGRPPSGSPLMLLTSGQTLHTDPRCPRNQSTHEFRWCMYCTDFDG